MATKVFTDADITFLTAQNGVAGSDWDTIACPAWISAASMNGATGLITYAAPASPRKILIQPFGLFNDDATIPPVITITQGRVQFSWTIVTLGPSGPTEISDTENVEAVPAGGSGSFDHTVDPATYFGGTTRADFFNGLAIWEFASTGVSAQQSITVTGYTFTLTYTTPSTPAVTSVTPSSGSVNGGTAVTIHGEGFTGALGAEFGGVAVTSFVVVNDFTATAVTGAHASGLVDVEVLGVATGTDLYTYTLDHISLPPIPTRTPITQGGGKGRG